MIDVSRLSQPAQRAGTHVFLIQCTLICIARQKARQARLIYVPSPSLKRANGLPARDGSAAAKAAQREFDVVGEICREHRIPWVLLSGGAAPDDLNACWISPMPPAPAGFSRAAPSGSMRSSSIFRIARRSPQACARKALASVE